MVHSFRLFLPHPTTGFRMGVDFGVDCECYGNIDYSTGVQLK